MGLISFKSYRESSASTRNKAAAAQGLQPPYSADVFGHATPNPATAEKLLKMLDDKPKKKKKTVTEGKAQKPDYSFDNFIKKAEQAAKDTDKDIQQADKDVENLEKTSKTKQDKIKADAKKAPFPPEKKDEPKEKAEFNKPKETDFNKPKESNFNKPKVVKKDEPKNDPKKPKWVRS